jgi:streptogramin lyase
VVQVSRIELVAVLVLAGILVASFAVYLTYYTGSGPSCQAVQGGKYVRSQASKTGFGAVTEYKLPGLGRWPNAVTTAPDGSVWFAEQEVPGVAHLFPNNGTLVEYAWTGYTLPKLPDCIPNVSSFGIALWNGRVWAADEFGNRMIGLNPTDGSTVTVDTAGKAPFPYWLAVGPDGNLWFTSDNAPARLGRIEPNMSLEAINLQGLGQENPLQLDFVNSSLAYFSTINLSNNSTTHSCVCTGHIYSFNPQLNSGAILPVKVGGSFRLVLPTSVSYSNEGLWVAQHGSSSVVRYDFVTRAWTVYPTSIVSWVDTTLPLEIQAFGSRVWFNEHYANKIALLDPKAGTLVEYSESSSPASGVKDIQNDESIVAVPGGLWFTSLSGNYVGFVDAGYDPGFQLTPTATDAVTLLPGGNASFTLRLAGTWSGPLTVNASDSENPQSIPGSIRIIPSTNSFSPGGSSPVDLGVKVEVSQTARPGSYTIAVTVTNGDVQKTAYLFVNVS